MRQGLIIASAAFVLALANLTDLPSYAAAQAAPQAQPAQQGGQRGQQGQAGAQQGGQRGQQGAQQGRGGRGQQQPAVPSKPTPRWPDGKPILGTPPGEKGIWGSCCGNLSNENTPYQPWAKAVYDDRRANELEPHTRCKPSGGSRQFVTPYGSEMVEIPELQRMYIFDIGGPHTVRTIYLDGRPHPKDWTPSYYGHSVGKWEGDTLVVETTGFNESFWIDRAGTPHTEKLVFTERFTRTDYNTLQYQVTIDDPGAYTAPWKTNVFNMRWNGNSELFEYVCQDNNFAHTLMVGTQEQVDRSSPIIP
jgi:hypothetical protein